MYAYWIARVGLCSFFLVYLASSGQAADGTEGSTATVFHCYDCYSKNIACPGDSYLRKKDEGTKLVVTNCTKDHRCFTRRAKVNNETNIYRGCTKVLGSNLPSPLPPKDGCYDYNGENMCLCSYDRCNKAPLGKSTGVKINAHLLTASGGIRPPPYKPRGDKETILCNVCNSGKPGEENFRCMRDLVADYSTTWKENCTGRCITRTNFLSPEVGVYRGCSDMWYKFPTPFPRDGCYTYYGDTVCVCNYDLCNSQPLGRHNNIELDDHLRLPTIDGNAGMTRTFSSLVIVLSLVSRKLL